MANINAFAQAPEQGEMDLQQSPGDVISGQIDSTQAVAIVPGQAVKLVDSAGGVPKFVATAADTDVPFGFVVRNLKDINVNAYDRCEVALFGSVMYMTSGAAIARGASVEVVTSTSKVIAAAGVNPVVGFALDKATATDQLIRVYIQTAGPQVLVDGTIQSVNVTATLAEINAGKTLVPARTGKKIKVVGFVERVTGNFAATTSVDLQSSNGTPVKVAVTAVAALTTGAVLLPSSANVTLGAGFGVGLGTGDALVVANVGSAATTGTSIQYTIQFAYVN